MVDLQTKIFSLLDADATLTTTLGVSVYDHTPDNEPYPFVQVGEDTFDDWSAHDFDGRQVTFQIHTWTQGEGRKTCKQIQDRVYTILNNIDLAITGTKTIALRSGTTTTMLDPDGRTHHGVNSFDLIIVECP